MNANTAAAGGNPRQKCQKGYEDDTDSPDKANNSPNEGEKTGDEWKAKRSSVLSIDASLADMFAVEPKGGEKTIMKTAVSTVSERDDREDKSEGPALPSVPDLELPEAKKPQPPDPVHTAPSARSTERLEPHPPVAALFEDKENKKPEKKKTKTSEEEKVDGKRSLKREKRREDGESRKRRKSGETKRKRRKGGTQSTQLLPLGESGEESREDGKGRKVQSREGSSDEEERKAKRKKKRGEDASAVKISVDRDKLTWALRGGMQKLKITNETGTRQGVKVKCSDNQLYKAYPVGTFVDTGATITLQLTRKPAKRSKVDILVIMNTPALSDDDDDVFQLFKNGASFQSTIVELEAV